MPTTWAGSTSTKSSASTKEVLVNKNKKELLPTKEFKQNKEKKIKPSNWMTFYV